MRRLVVLCIPVIALAGCASLADLAVLPRSVQAGSYDCAPADDSGMRHRIVAVAHDRNGRDVNLRLESGQQFALSPVAGASHRLYSGPLYAWRASSGRSVLTDVETVQTYDCRRIGSVQAATLPPGANGPSAAKGVR